MFSVFFLALTTFGCSEAPVKPSGKQDEKLFFDLKGYFDKEVVRLSKLRRIKKITSVNGNREERLLDSIDFERELGIFSSADLNRPAWADKYLVDSVFIEQNKLARLNYIANDGKLKTKRISIDFRQGKVVKIFIENSTVSAVTNMKQLLIYEPERGYSIESRNGVALAADNTFLVEVRFH